MIQVADQFIFVQSIMVLEEWIDAIAVGAYGIVCIEAFLDFDIVTHISLLKRESRCNLIGSNRLDKTLQ